MRGRLNSFSRLSRVSQPGRERGTEAGPELALPALGSGEVSGQLLLGAWSAPAAERPARDGASLQPGCRWESEERAGGGKRGCTHRRLLQTGERSLKGCPAGVGSGAGVAAGAHRTALTASGRRRGPYPQTRPLISHNSRRRAEKWEVGVGEANHPLPTQRMVFLAWNRLPFVLCCQNV